MDASSDNTEPAGGEDTTNITLADCMHLEATLIFRIVHARTGGTDPFSVSEFLRRSMVFRCSVRTILHLMLAALQMY